MKEHLLCFVTDDDGQLFIHADASGLDLLIRSLSNIRRKSMKTKVTTTI
jgi:hypothetical protein